MSKPIRPVATNGGDRIISDVSYDRDTSTATIAYEDGEAIRLSGCDEHEYGLCLIVTENRVTRGNFDLTFFAGDDVDIDMYARMIRASRDGVSEDPAHWANDIAMKNVRLSFRTMGIPATFRRMDHWILPQLQLLSYAELRCLTPIAIEIDMIERFQGTDYAFERSSLLRGRTRNF